VASGSSSQKKKPKLARESVLEGGTTAGPCVLRCARDGVLWPARAAAPGWGWYVDPGARARGTSGTGTSPRRERGAFPRGACLPGAAYGRATPFPQAARPSVPHSSRSIALFGQRRALGMCTGKLGWDDLIQPCHPTKRILRPGAARDGVLWP
jgi:hypothetical protein